MKWPNSDSSSSPTGFSSETGVWAARRICSISSVGRSSSLRELLARGQAAVLGLELALGAHDPVQLLDHVHRHPDRAPLVGERPGDGLADPPGGVGRELEALAVVELLGRAHQPDRALLNQIEEGQALVSVALGDRDDEAQVGLDHLLLGAVVAALDPLRQLHLLRGRQQVDAADLLEEELQRVGRQLAPGLRHFDRLGRSLAVHDFDLELVEGVVELVQLLGVELELVERGRDVLGSQRAGGAAGLEQNLRLLGGEEIEVRGPATVYRCGPRLLLPTRSLLPHVR